MKNLKYIIPIFLLMLCVILFVIYNETTCSLENCDNTRVNGADTTTAKARWVLIYIHFQIYSKVYETNEFL